MQYVCLEIQSWTRWSRTIHHRKGKPTYALWNETGIRKFDLINIIILRIFQVVDIKSRPTFAGSNFKRVVHSPRNQSPLQFARIWSLYQSFVSNACMRPRYFGESTRNGDQTDYHEGCKHEKGIRWQVSKLRVILLFKKLNTFEDGPRYLVTQGFGLSTRAFFSSNSFAHTSTEQSQLGYRTFLKDSYLILRLKNVQSCTMNGEWNLEGSLITCSQLQLLSAEELAVFENFRNSAQNSSVWWTVFSGKQAHKWVRTVMRMNTLETMMTREQKMVERISLVICEWWILLTRLTILNL